MTGEQQAQTAAFGQRLRALRKQQGLSRHELSWRTGLIETDIGRYERGRRDPRLTTILRLARGLDLPPGELVDGLR